MAATSPTQPTASLFLEATGGTGVQETPVAESSATRILIVDDDRGNLLIISRLLAMEGYTTRTAASAEAAWDCYQDFRPDLLLLDVEMPGMNGFDLCRRLRKERAEDNVPILFLTARNDAEDVVEGLDAGASDYLTKPFRSKEALARIRTHLNHRRLLVEKQQLLETLSKLNWAKNRCLSMAAHDLRNPTLSIRGLTEFLKDGTLGELKTEQLEVVTTIHGASLSLLDLLNQLLDLSVIESGEITLKRAETDLDEILFRALQINQIMASKKEMRLIFPGERHPMLARVDAPKITQVADNLLSNAIKYSPPGSTIELLAESTEQTCSFAICDGGPGIPEDEQPKLFKEFGRASTLPTGGEKSVGLGLAICKRIVDAHGGAISVRNLPQRGCEFRVTLPR